MRRQIKLFLSIILITILFFVFGGCAENKTTNNNENTGSNSNLPPSEPPQLTTSQMLLEAFKDEISNAKSFSLSIESEYWTAEFKVEDEKYYCLGKIEGKEISDTLSLILEELGLFNQLEFYLEKDGDDFFVYEKLSSESKWEKTKIEKDEYDEMKKIFFKEDSFESLFDYINYDYSAENKQFSLKTGADVEFMKMKDISLKLVKNGVEISGELQISLLITVETIDLTVAIKDINNTTVNLPEIIE